MKSFLFLLSLLYFSAGEVYHKGDVVLLKEGLTHFFTTGTSPKYFKDVVKNHQLELSFFGFPTLANVSDSSMCELCDVGLNLVINSLKKGIPEFIVRSMVIEICKDFHIEDERVCKGLLDPEMDVFVYIMKNKADTKGEKFCSLLLGAKCHIQFDYYNWSIDIPARPSKIPKKIISNSTKNIRILQVTDIHYDPRYTAGAKAVCGEILCCQDDQGTPDKSEEACGVWGDYRDSDTPRRTLYEALRHMKTQDVDYVYFTGDIISHRIWSTSKANNSNEEIEVMGLLTENFDVPLLFVLGNHEPHPANTYAPASIEEENFSTKWLFDQLADELKEFISDKELENVKKGGFYTMTLNPGFRIIVLNSSVCFIYNLWLAYESYDPYGQLAWLVKVLEQAEKNGEYVHILHHFPSGDNTCLGTWSREFTRIIDRFSETITGHFNGHTHVDEFFLYFSKSNNSEAINVAFNGASLTTFPNSNPSYKIYDIDSQNYQVVDAEEWTFNLTAANLQPEKSTVDWYKLYSFKETYAVSTMQPEELNKLVIRMAKDKSLLQVYAKNRYRMGSGAEIPCDDDCYKSILCTIVTSNLADTDQCEKIKKVYDDNK